MKLAPTIITQTIQAKDLTLNQLEAKFSLTLAQDKQFFQEWLKNLPPTTEPEKRSLDRVKDNLFQLDQVSSTRKLAKARKLAKDGGTSPLLDLAGFYRSPFWVETETAGQISAEDEREIKFSPTGSSFTF